MSVKPKKQEGDLKALLLEDILDMTDQELKEELKHRNLRSDDLLKAFDAALEKATATATRLAYEQAKARLNKTESGAAPQFNISISRARSELGRLASSGNQMLLAARKGVPLDKLPDGEIDSLARDMVELGILKPEDVA